MALKTVGHSTSFGLKFFHTHSILLSLQKKTTCQSKIDYLLKVETVGHSTVLEDEQGLRKAHGNVFLYYLLLIFNFLTKFKKQKKTILIFSFSSDSCDLKSYNSIHPFLEHLNRFRMDKLLKF